MYEIFERLLIEKGVRAADVSRATGVPQSTLTDWKKGRSVPKMDKIEKLAAYFGVQPEYILKGETPEGITKKYSLQTFEKMGILLGGEFAVNPERLSELIRIFGKMDESDKDLYIELGRKLINKKENS